MFVVFDYSNLFDFVAWSQEGHLPGKSCII